MCPIKYAHLRDAFIALHRRDLNLTGIHRVESISEKGVSTYEHPVQKPRHILQGEDCVPFHFAIFIYRRFSIDQTAAVIGKADVIVNNRNPILFITENTTLLHHRMGDMKNSISDIGNAVRFHLDKTSIFEVYPLLTIVYATFAHLHTQNIVAYNRRITARIDSRLNTLKERTARDVNASMAVLHH